VSEENFETRGGLSELLDLAKRSALRDHREFLESLVAKEFYRVGEFLHIRGPAVEILGDK
jgi:hypothetical protein